MKKILLSVLGLLLCGAAVWACFDDDPFSDLSKPEVTVSGGDGSTSDVTTEGGTTARDDNGNFSPVNPDFPDLPDLKPEEQTRKYADILVSAFPLTLNVAFSGFIDPDGKQCNQPITRLCLLYFSTAGKWIILKDIRNPKYQVVSDAEGKRALFGKHTIPSAMGYPRGDVMPVMLYFEGHNHQSFNLNAVLTSADKVPFDNMAIGIRPTDNIRPY